MIKRLLFLFFIPSVFNAQTKNITLEEIWSGQFTEKHIENFIPLNNNEYTTLNFDFETRSSFVIKHSFENKKTDTILSNKFFKKIPLFDKYSFNSNETKIIFRTERQQIYRRSIKGVYYIYDLLSKELNMIDNERINEPTFSPDSKKICFTKNNNIFIYDISQKTSTQVTFDGKKNQIINGTTDWVYEEEFGFVKAFEWNNNSSKIAFLKFNEKEVPEYSMNVFYGQLYPSNLTFKYPKAGEKNAEVSLFVYDTNLKKTKKIDLGDYEYIPNIKWSNDENLLSAITMNRHQNDLQLFSIDIKSNKTKVILQEKNNTYVDINFTNQHTYLKDNSFIWTSETDGFNHIYHYSKEGKLLRKITSGNWVVTKLYGIDEKQKKIYYQSTEDNTIDKTVYSISLTGKKKKRIGKSSGLNDIIFSKDKNYIVYSHSSATIPTNYSLLYKGKFVKEILNNKPLSDKLSKYTISTKEFSKLKTSTGNFNMWMIKPANFDASKKYPLLLFQYSGPGSQRVDNKWRTPNNYWFQMLAQKGIIIACVDGRGTGFRGAEFKKCTYKELGKFETIDQIEAAKTLGNLPYIDANKLGIWGWSFGGFVASNAILKGNNVFNTAIAVAPVTSWRFYDSVYTEKFMQTPQENPKGYDDNSPIYHADKLKGNYLIVHGSGDDNVHVQNTYEMINALVKANKEFEQAIYPDRAHGIYKGRNTRLHLFTKLTNFIEKHLIK
jgi:dipeptidyl-peptidase-4